MSGCRVELQQLLDRVDHLNGPEAPTDMNGQREPAELIDHVDEHEGPPIHRLIELEADAPDVVGIFGPQQLPLAARRT